MPLFPTTLKSLLTLPIMVIASGCVTTALASDCPNLELPCAATDIFAVLSDDPLEVEELAAETVSAANKYYDQFKSRPPATIIVPGGSISSDMQEKLEANGYAVLMPWITAKQRQALRENMVRSQIEAQLAGQPDMIRDAAIASALSQLSNMTTESPTKSVLAHELGHKWFIAQFAKAEDDQTQHAYGGWAPDWLDEAIAVSMENAALQSRRRNVFADAGVEGRIALSEFLTMEHPSAEAARALAERVRKIEEAQSNPSINASETMPGGPVVKTVRRSSRVITLSGEEGKQFVADSGGDRVLMFYAQALLLGDYLTARTSNRSILTEIATSLLSGQSFEAWLANNEYGLPHTLEALEVDWTAFNGEENP